MAPVVRLELTTRGLTVRLPLVVKFDVVTKFCHGFHKIYVHL